MKTITLLLFSFSLQAQCLKLDIMVVCDLSGSVYGHELFIASAIQSFTDRFELSEETMKIGIVAFGNKAQLLSPLIADKEDLNKIINYISVCVADGSTDMSGGLMMAMNELQQGRKGVMQIVILISDGIPDSKEDTERISQQLTEMMNVGICGIFINSAPGRENQGGEFLKSISSNLCYVESNYESLADQLKKMDICL